MFEVFPADALQYDAGAVVVSVCNGPLAMAQNAVSILYLVRSFAGYILK